LPPFLKRGLFRPAASLMLLLASACGTLPDLGPAPVIVGMDHIPVAVHDLDQAAADYRRLGFALKPGRVHENGIRNQHVKFEDGTEIELITASEARDEATADYLVHLSHGDGPAFAGFYAPDRHALTARLDDLRQPYVAGDEWVTLPDVPLLRYMFFSGRNHSPTDRPETFAHPNGAQSLIGVWIARDNADPERHLLSVLGAKLTTRQVHVPDEMNATVATLPEAEVSFLPSSRQLVPGRPVVGAVLLTRNVETVQQVLAAAHIASPPIVQSAGSRSVFVPPALTHGLWLEFRERR